MRIAVQLFYDVPHHEMMRSGSASLTQVLRPLGRLDIEGHARHVRTFMVGTRWCAAIVAGLLLVVSAGWLLHD